MTAEQGCVDVDSVTVEGAGVCPNPACRVLKIPFCFRLLRAGRGLPPNEPASMDIWLRGIRE